MSLLRAEPPPSPGWTSEWGRTEGVTSLGAGGGPRGRGAEGTSGPYSLWFQSSSPSEGAAYVPHKICGTDVAWHQTKPGWFGTVLFQTEHKCSLLSDNAEDGFG